jgi:hypothetical protein
MERMFSWQATPCPTADRCVAVCPSTYSGTSTTPPRASRRCWRFPPNIFYPGHDRPFKLDGDEINYLEGPTQIEIVGNLEGGGVTALNYKVQAVREPNISIVQKD